MKKETERGQVGVKVNVSRRYRERAEETIQSTHGLTAAPAPRGGGGGETSQTRGTSAEKSESAGDVLSARV